MGIELQFFRSDNNEKIEQNVGSHPARVDNILRQTMSLSPQDLMQYFENLFKQMTMNSKEAVNELIWRGLSAQEQSSFEMPYYGHRWSESTIINAFQDPFSREPPNSDAAITGRRALNFTDTSIHFSAGTNTVTRGTASRLDQETSPWSPNRSITSPLEDQFFNILRDAIVRAERQAVSEGAMPRQHPRGFTRIPIRTVNVGTTTLTTVTTTVNTGSAGTNTNNDIDPNDSSS